MWGWKEMSMISFRIGSIRRRLLVWNLAVFGLALLGIVLASYFYLQRQIKEDSFELQAEIASLVAARIDAYLNQKIERLSDAAVSMSLHPVGSREQELLAVLLLKNDTAFTDAAILDSKGMEVVKVSERKVYTLGERSDQSGSDKFKKAIEGKTYISPVYTSDKAEPYVILALPLKATHRDIIGVLSAKANLKFLWEIIGNIHFGVAGYAYLVDSQGNLIAHKDPSLVLRRTNLSHIHEVQEFLRNPVDPDPTPTDEAHGITGKPVLSTYAPLRGMGWAVILEEPLDMALADVKMVRHFALLLMGIGLSVGAIVIIWVANRITRPIRELQTGVKTISSGNLEHQVAIKTGDEIQSLADEFNSMARKLKTSHATLEEKVDQRTGELSALYDVTRTVNQSLELEPVLQEVIKKITLIFGFEATRIVLFDPTMKELHVRASYESRPRLWRQVPVTARGHGITGRVAETGQAMIFEDTHTDPRYLQLSQTKSAEKVGLHFLAVFPIMAKALCLGTLHCVGQNPRRLAGNEIRLLTSMADQIGVAVENANLFARMSDKSMALEKVNLQLQEASRIKSEFMAAMSHELRTPLNVIMGNVELMADRFFGDVTESQKKSLVQITHHAQVLLKLINNVLTLTKMEGGKMPVESNTIEVDEIIANVKGYAEQLSRNGQPQILWKVEPNLPPINTDALKLEEILQNLIGNAHKFTPSGSIEIRVRNLNEKKRFAFSVADTGIGIEEKDLDKVFDEFHQLREAHTGNFDGFGLGLNIVKKYLDLMQGDIRVESHPGIGTTFTFTLPYSPLVDATDPSA
jgi:signal transduction histidine kinase